jgi:hypothetical protein
MKFDELSVGTILRSDEHKISYLIYEIADNNVSMVDITSKEKYLPWDKVARDEWNDDQYGIWGKLVRSKNRFDMHTAIDVAFTGLQRLE